MRARDLTGIRFGRLVALELEPERYFGKRVWKCRCDCGNATKLPLGALVTGNTKSCGCLGQEARIAASTLHGMTGTRTFNIWKGIKNRCSNSNHHSWKYYGARGISMSPRWSESFLDFLSDMGVCPDGLTVERINNEGNYEAGNCRWATMAEQNRNKRRSA